MTKESPPMFVDACNSQYNGWNPSMAKEVYENSGIVYQFHNAGDASPQRTAASLSGVPVQVVPGIGDPKYA